MDAGNGEDRACLAVTTSGKCDERTIARAQRYALAWGLPYLQRPRKAPLQPLLNEVVALLVFEAGGLSLCDSEGSLQFSPGMAQLRIKRLNAGAQEDRFVRVGKFEPGDSVLDCTLGLGADALVAAHVVGATGRVVGLEKSLAIFALASFGVNSFDRSLRSCRIDVRHQDSADFLAKQPAKTFDHVLFDPMFDRPGKCSPAFQMLRRYADHAPLTAQMLEDARRVARRAVLVKGAHYSMQWKRLQLTPDLASRYSPVSWARLAAM